MNAPDFSKIVRNPLGVIGLFIWLIYSIAGLVFASSASELSYSIQLILALFVVMFPAAILAVFYILVTKHHKKLYAPSDYKDERLFFRPATDKEVREKNEEEDANSDPAAMATQPTGSSEAPEPEGPHYSDIESLALDHAQTALGRDISRDYVAEVDGHKFIFDGVHQDDKRLYLFEVKYYRRPVFKKEFLEAVLYRASSIVLHESLRGKDRKFCLWLLIVGEFDGPAMEEFEKQVKASIDTNNFAVKWFFLSRKALES